MTCTSRAGNRKDAVGKGQGAEGCTRVVREGPSRAQEVQGGLRRWWRATKGAVLWMITRLGTMRIGEASSPGPGSPMDDSNRVDARTLAYPTPLREGFRCIRTLGFVDEAWIGEVEVHREDFSLVVECVNTIGWKALQKRLKSTHAHVVLAEEHWRRASQVAAASRWALARGWKSVWAEAEEADGGRGAKAGAAIFARDALGLRLPNKGPQVLVEARAIVTILDAIGCSPITLVALTLKSGEGMSRENQAILRSVLR